MLIAQVMRFGEEATEKGLCDDRLCKNYPMMSWMGTNTSAFWISEILWLATWVMIIVVLITLARWLWKKGNNEKKGR